MHLDTVFTFCDRDLVNVLSRRGRRDRPVQPAARRHAPCGFDVRRTSKPFLDVVQEALGLERLRVVDTGGDRFEQEREQWDDGNNVVALEPGVVVAYDRNVHTNTLLRKAGIEVITIAGRSWAGSRRRPLHDLPDPARPSSTFPDRLISEDSSKIDMPVNLRHRDLPTWSTSLPPRSGSCWSWRATSRAPSTAATRSRSWSARTSR